MPAKGWRKPKAEPRAGAVIVQGRLCIACAADPERELIGFLRQFAKVRKQAGGGRRGCIPPRSPYASNRTVMRLLTQIVREGLYKRKGVIQVPEEAAVKLAKLPERIAVIVGKTYVVKGDGAELADDEALGMICDLLNELDETLIPRNKDKRLARNTSPR
ncbi:MAG TPA: hypothetical protein VE262_21910 [Blastocatellia bacterium]|nr:hypothetical protein [Blastocatellia bacterium]